MYQGLDGNHGGKSVSWRVVGITPAAVDAFAAADFRLKSGQGITGAHLRPRIETVRELLAPDTPLSEREFLDIWLTNDRTILCARGENRLAIPKYIPIENDDGTLFSCHGKLAGWHHRKRERGFLKQLFDERVRQGPAVPDR
jgi:hypothetical protein